MIQIAKDIPRISVNQLIPIFNKKKGDAYKEVEGEEQLEQYANTGGAVGRVGPHDEEQSPQRIEKQ